MRTNREAKLYVCGLCGFVAHAASKCFVCDALTDWRELAADAKVSP
jgi:rubrerythrin